MEILLNKAKSVKNTNIDNYIGVEFTEESRPLSEEQSIQKIDEYERYAKEKDACTNYRLSFIISPICSNVLFNRVSEIVYHEGGDDCIEIGSESDDVNSIDSVKAYHKDYLNDGGRKINRYQAIRDTCYSNDKIGPFVYHCGYDIFNNHFLRQREFATVGKLNLEGEPNFNTLTDYVRDENGNRVTEKKRSCGASGETKPIHLYQYDTVKSFSETIKENLIEDENGWWGFINTSTLPVKNYYEEVLNRTMCNNKSCEQYDMYPDRSLYSFLPKYNKFRDRYEDNWKFCLTYPSESLVNKVVENGLQCYVVPMPNTERFDRTVLFRSDVFHNLRRNSLVEMRFDGIVCQTSVFSVGDNAGNNTGYYFSVPYEDIKEGLAKVKEGLDEKEKEIRFAKIVNGGVCKYYFRVFKKIPKANGENGYYKPLVNKLGFSHTYYSDENVELLFNRDVSVKGLTDNLGRELSEIYLTVVKNNKGYKDWYENKNKRSKDIEFSHCFGDISSGMDLPTSSNKFNVHKIHNVIQGGGYNEMDSNVFSIPESPDALETGITIDNETFLGDLVEFSPNTVEETVLEYVYHRFNTAQREYTTDAEYRNIYYEEIITDDDDVTAQGTAELKTEKKIYNTVDGTTDKTFPANIAPEGYYYNPHYVLKLKEFSSKVQQGSDIRLIFLADSVQLSNNSINGVLSRNYGLSENDEIYALFNGVQHKCVVEHIEYNGATKNQAKITLMEKNINFPQSMDELKLFRPNPIKPKGAYELNDGTGRYLWRDMLSTKEIGVNDEMHDYIFTNGAVYIHRNLNFFLRRQDPFGEYGLNNMNKIGIPQHMSNLIIGGSSYDYKIIEYKTENTTQQC